ncbi:GntT/GntP/DsdX family permease [Acetobacter fallax]|uniref:Permease DsdX n=1 Tax=Acetobacter fallax TaxID=1737473 RepID=A0ABX0KC52_9PROT|nr:gluconate:H+ symporter [Acetobacter fallax]NHO33368.1 permease DsdX [Acetobacter fallax]NHO36987.1 permease DsdX [Acetobacter fallax]
MTPVLAACLAAGAIGAVVVLISRLRFSPFIALFLVSICLGLIAGMPPEKTVSAFEAGVGHVLGHVAPVIALGTMLGKMLAESGGADVIALTIGRLAGRGRADWGMMAVGLLIGLPVFFEVGFVLLIPLAVVMARQANVKLISIALPMATALSVTHAMIPPHPATLLAVTAYHADTGLTILWGILIGTPVAALAGPVYARWISPRIHIENPNGIAAQFEHKSKVLNPPGFVITATTVFSPVLMMLIGSASDFITTKGSLLNTTLHFIGNTDIALLIATLLSFQVFGTARGFSRATILDFANECVAPTAIVLLVVGAGGGFGHVLIESGLSGAITSLALGAHVPLMILAWLLAAIVRIATGSATVAMTTASGIIGPMVASAPAVSPELLVIATGAGSIAFGPLNDAGFWQIKEYLGMSVSQTVKTWSVIETLISLLGLGFALLLSMVVS